MNNQYHPMTISSPRRNSGIDFSDVFGGPPRQASIQETKYSFNDSNSQQRARNHDQGDDDDDDDDDDTSYDEKPVFGDEFGGVNKRRYPSEDFFDDIFKGKDYSLSSSPRKHDRDLLSSSLGSRVLSPVRPLPPRAESFGRSSFPAQFSLPARLIKGTDLPFGSSSHNQYKNKDAVSNGLGNYSLSPLSRFSNQGNQVQEGLEKNAYHQSYLSRQLSNSSEESSDLAKPDEKENKRKLERQVSASDLDGPDVRNKGNQFHFSIYKWAGRGVPLAMLFRGGRSSGLKERSKFERSSSYNTWINGDVLSKRTPKITPHDPEFPPCNSSLSSPAASLTVEMDELKDCSFADTSLQGTVEQGHSIEKTSLPKLESETSSSHPAIAEDDFSNILSEHTKELEANGVTEVAFLERKAEALSSFTVESPKAKLKQSCSLFFDNDHELVVDKIVTNDEEKGNKVEEGMKKPSAFFNVEEGMKKDDDRSRVAGKLDGDKTNLCGSPKNSVSNNGKNKVGGKVKEFVKIFNQETSCKAELDVESPRQSKMKETGKLRTQDAPSAASTIVDEKLRSPSKNNKTDASIVADEYLKKSERQQPEARPNNNSTNCTPESKRSLPPIVEQSSSSESAPAGLEATIGDTDGSFHENFLVIDDKIRNWSRGKEWNIRSLLSTLQYVLWPESGWKPVPLVDIIEGNAVRRSYQKALLFLHPDKLQQKGATSHQKYIAEKVFDILQVNFSSVVKVDDFVNFIDRNERDLPLFL